jgi:hypothetical protein
VADAYLPECTGVATTEYNVGTSNKRDTANLENMVVDLREGTRQPILRFDRRDIMPTNT